MTLAASLRSSSSVSERAPRVGGLALVVSDICISRSDESNATMSRSLLRLERRKEVVVQECGVIRMRCVSRMRWIRIQVSAGARACGFIALREERRRKVLLKIPLFFFLGFGYFLHERKYYETPIQKKKRQLQVRSWCSQALATILSLVLVLVLVLVLPSFKV